MVLKRESFASNEQGEAWQYLSSIKDAFEGAKYLKTHLLFLNKQKQERARDILCGNMEFPDDERFNLIPGDFIEIGDRKISTRFIVSIDLIEFFQLIRNSLDYVSHVVNILFMNKRNYKIDFIILENSVDGIQNINVRNWIKELSDSTEFVYLDDYCNNVKHNLFMNQYETIDFNSLEIKNTIPAFSKEHKKNQIVNHKQLDVKESIKRTYDYFSHWMSCFFDMVYKHVEEEG